MNIKRKIASLIIASVIILGTAPSVPAQSSIKTVGNSEYLCVDLSEYANCIGFDETGTRKEGIEYIVPDFFGVGRSSSTDQVNIIYNKIAADRKKDTEGFIYDVSDRPFYIRTDLGEKNTVLLGAGDYLNNRTVTIEIPNGRYHEISFVADSTYTVDAGAFVFEIVYDDGTKTIDTNWEIYGKDKSSSALLEKNGVDSYIPFEYKAATPEEPDAPKNTGLFFRMKDANPDIPEGASYSLPVYTLTADKTKNAVSVKITQNSQWYGLNIFALTAKRVSKKEEITEQIASLPNASEINFGNYTNYKELVEEINNAVNNGIEVDDSDKSKITEIYNKIQELENNPIEEINYLIDNLSGENEISEENVDENAEKIRAIEEKLTEESDIDIERLQKYQQVKERVTTVTNIRDLKKLIDFLPEAEKITLENYFEYTQTIEAIQKLLDSGTETDSQRINKFEEVKKAVYEAQYTYNPYVTMDFSESYNAVIFGTTQITTDDPMCVTPYYLGARQSDASVERYPTMILNKNAFNNLKKKDGIIYSAEKQMPLYVDTEGGVILGSNAKNRILEKNIPVKQGNYKNISIAAASTYQIEPSQFKFVINYTDGTSTIDPDWLIPQQQTNFSAFSEYECVSDYIFAEYDADNKEETSPILRRNGKNYMPQEYGTAFPIVTLEAEAEKTVKSITLTQTDEWRSIAVLAITAELPSQTELKEIIEKNISELDENNIPNEYDKIYTLSNMIEKYSGTVGSQPIDNIEKFERISKKFFGSIVEIESVTNRTDFNNTIVQIDFKNNIDTSDLMSLIKVTSNDETVNDYIVNVISENSIEIILENDLNYNKTYSVIISSKLSSAVDSEFTMKNEYVYKFTPEIPLSVEELSLTDGMGNNIESIVNENRVYAKIKVKNNTLVPKTQYALSLCLFDEDNKLIKIYLEQHEIAVNSTDEKTFSFDIPSDNKKYKLICFVMDGFSSMNKISETIIK